MQEGLYRRRREEREDGELQKEGYTEEKKVIKMKEGELMKNSWMGGVKISEVKQEAGRRGRMGGVRTEDNGGMTGGGDWHRRKGSGNKKREKGRRVRERYKVKRRCEQQSRAERERCIKTRMVEKSEG